MAAFNNPANGNSAKQTGESSSAGFGSVEEDLVEVWTRPSGRGLSQKNSREKILGERSADLNRNIIQIVNDFHTLSSPL